MKKILVTMIVAALALTLSSSAASATDYSGTDPTQGIFGATGPVTAGEQMTFSYADLQAGSGLNVVLTYPNGSTVTLTSATVPSGGSGSVSFALPGDLPAGTYTVSAQGTRANGSAFNASTTATLGQQLGGTGGSTPTNAGGDTLAITGVETPSLIGAAALLMMLGTGFVLVSRRRDVMEDELVGLK